jgi:hypothetical protein
MSRRVDVTILNGSLILLGSSVVSSTITFPFCTAARDPDHAALSASCNVYTVFVVPEPEVARTIQGPPNTRASEKDKLKMLETVNGINHRHDGTSAVPLGLSECA